MTTKAQQCIPPKVVKIIEELSCELTDSEWQSRARDLAEAHKEVARQEDRKKTVTAGLNNDVKIAKAKESKLADIVATREEQREVTIEVRYDYEIGTVSKTRTDTGEIISERELTDDERQQDLFNMDEVKKVEEAVTPPIEEEPVESTSDEPLIKEIDRFKLNDDEYLYEFNTGVDQPIYSKNGKAITEKAFTDAFNKAQGAKAKDVEDEEEPEEVDPFDELDEENYDQSA